MMQEIPIKLANKTMPAYLNFQMNNTIQGPIMKSWKSQAKYQLSPMQLIPLENK